MHQLLEHWKCCISPGIQFSTITVLTDLIQKEASNNLINYYYIQVKSPCIYCMDASHGCLLFFWRSLHAHGPTGAGYQSFPAWWIAPDKLITPYYADSPRETASPFKPDWSRKFPLTRQASPQILPPCWIWRLAGYGDSFIIMWEGESRICGSQLLSCQRWRDKSRAFVISTDQISLLYLYGPLLPRFVSVSPLLPHVRVGWSRAFAELLWSEISSFFPLSAQLQAHCNISAAKRIDLMAKLVLP